MRKLGKGQSVVFCIPKEIEHKIITLKGSQSLAEEIETADVLCWVMMETCHDLRRSVPLWLTQGLRFSRQKVIWNEGVGSMTSKDKDHCDWMSKFLEDEAQSIDTRYRPGQDSLDLLLSLEGADPTMTDEFQQRCADFGVNKLHAASLQEEQERELSPEAEREFQVERPPRVTPLKHIVHLDFRHLIDTGDFRLNSKAFMPAFRAFENTAVAKLTSIKLAEFPRHIWATIDFINTIVPSKGVTNNLDAFQRSVYWALIVTENGNSSHRPIIISPFEAQHFLLSKRSQNVSLHIYSPRVNSEFRALDHLALYAVPQTQNTEVISRDAAIQLNLFAGQLYLSSFQEYKDVCDALGLAWSSPGSVTLAPDGFIPRDVKTDGIQNKSGFTKSPVSFFKGLMAKIRQDCESIDRTHMGKILDGNRLFEEDFET